MNKSNRINKRKLHMINTVLWFFLTLLTIISFSLIQYSSSNVMLPIMIGNSALMLCSLIAMFIICIVIPDEDSKMNSFQQKHFGSNKFIKGKTLRRTWNPAAFTFILIMNLFFGFLATGFFVISNYTICLFAYLFVLVILIICSFIYTQIDDKLHPKVFLFKKYLKNTITILVSAIIIAAALWIYLMI